MNGIVAYGAYLPYFRLDRKAIGEALGSGGGKGTRVVASYDEDTTSMGVEAARAALRGAPRLAPAAVYFATVDPAYLDKTNATAIHAALALDESAMAFDMLGSIRSAAGRSAARRTRGGQRWPCYRISGPASRAGRTVPEPQASLNRWEGPSQGFPKV
jgi:3-hydroxy-3-methylglutaryl CoA synthase